MIQLRSKEERLSYVDGYNNCFRLFCEYLKKKSTDDAIANMTAVVNLINETVGEKEKNAEMMNRKRKEVEDG